MAHSFGPTMIIDRCESMHQLPSALSSSIRSISSSSTWSRSEQTVGLDVDSDEEQQLAQHVNNDHQLRSFLIPPTALTRGYGAVRHRTTPKVSNVKSFSLNVDAPPKESIRFQVVVWDVGPVDVVLGRVPMTFRVTMFWNDEYTINAPPSHEEGEDSTDDSAPSRPPTTEWTMHGRRKAYERVVRDESIVSSAEVPPVSLLNVVTFDVIGQPEVCVLREKPSKRKQSQEDGRQQATVRRLMRWTCLYKATLLQKDMRLEKFPHDEHILSLKLGILVQRRAGGRWDMNQYRLDLATQDDSQYSTKIPHGLIVDHVSIPDFHYSHEEGLNFHFAPMSLGDSFVPPSPHPKYRREPPQQDCCLEVRLRVTRDSGYYDQNIMPLIGLLNIVAVAIPLSLEANYFFQRGLLLLNITFVQIGIRMNVDKHLPSVGYPIKMQKIMNQFFFSLLFLVLESSAVYILNEKLNWTIASTSKIDYFVSASALMHILFTWACYYLDQLHASEQLKADSKDKNEAEDMPKKSKRRACCLPL